ncbi:centromere protein F [Narcine bancroftii]|uniref:centromere protein F n=1 Tax=Narcine bancroftii TaxID=1343680 RepID=UPI0038317222
MSWAVEEWKEGLPTKALQKIQEIEVQLDKLKKERQQRQFQVETLEAALLKQKQKVENEKSETSALKREQQTLIDSCENLEKTRQRISHELQVKESQVNYLEGQLGTSKKLVEKLEQENKRFKSEIERCQTILKPADGTPQNNLSRSISPNKNVTDSKLEEMQEKYNKEVEERSRLEIELKTIQAKLFNQAQSRNTISQRNIARKQSSSVFPWHHDQTPIQCASHSLETPLKGVGMNLQWEQEETPFKHHPNSLQKGTCSSGWFNNSTDSSKQEEQLKSQNQELQAKVLDLEFRLAAQEQEVKNNLNKLHEIQFQFEKAKTDLSEKEHKLTKCREELTTMTAQYEQSSTKYVMVEQKLKQVSEELSCCRQNAESTRRSVEQKLKDKEKEFQEEIAHHQHSLRSLDQQSIHTKNKLNQELQQAKKDYNILQLDIDKLTACKHKLEKEMDEIRQQLRHSDQMLKAHQSKENDLKKKLEDVQKERNSFGTQLHQNTTQIHKLENELKKTKQDFNRACSYGEEMKNKNTAQEIELKDLRQQLNEQSKAYTIVENLKQQISQLKSEQDGVQKDMRKKEGRIEQLNAQIGTMQKTTEELQKEVQLKEKSCQELKEQNSSLAQWKSENIQVLDNFKHEKDGMENKIKELEQNLQFSLKRIREQEQNLEIYQCKGEKQAEALKLLEDEKEKLRKQTDDVKEMLGSKTLELEKQNQAFEELTKKARQDKSIVENLHLSISQLEKKLQQETNKVMKLEESQHVLNVEYKNLSNTAKAKDDLIEEKETVLLNLKSSISRITHNFEGQLARMEAEKIRFMEEHEKAMLDKVEVAKSALEKEIIVFKEQINSRDSLLKLEKHAQSELQNKYETLLKVKEELEIQIEAGKKYENLKAEMEEEINKLTMQLSALQVTVDEKNKSIQNFTQELENNLNHLKCLQITNKELETRLEVHSQLEKCLQEKEELISLREKALERLSQENDDLKVSINNLMQAKLELNKQNSNLVVMMEKKEEMIEEFEKYKEEIAAKENRIKCLKTLVEDLTDKQRMLESTVETKDNDIKQLLEKMNERESRERELVHERTALEEEIKNLQDQYTAAEKKQNFLKEQLCESANVLLMKSAEVEELERKCAQDSVDYNAKIVSYEEKVKALVEEIVDLKSQLERTKEIDQLEKELAGSSARQDRILEDYNQLLQDKEQLTHLMQSQAEKENGFAAKIEKLENDLATAESENIKNSKLIAGKAQISDQLRDTILTKEVEIQRLQAQLQLLQMDLEDKEISSETCMAQLNEMQTEASIMETKFQHSEENRLLLDNKVSTMQEEMEALYLRISELRNNEESLLQDVSLQKQTVEELKSELKKQEQDFHSLESQLNESQAKEKQYHLKEREMLELQDKLFRSETQIMELISQKSNMEFQLDCLQQELNAQMQSTLNDVKNTIERSEEQRVLLQQDLNKAQSDLQQSEEQRVLLQQDLNKAQSDLQQSEEQRVLLQQHLNKAQSDLQQSEEQRALLQQHLNKAQSDLQQSEEQRALLQQDLNKVQSNLQQSEEQRVLLQQHLNEAQSDLQQSEEQRVLLQQDLNKVQFDLQQSEEQRVLLQQDLNKAHSDLQQSEEQRVLLQQHLNKAQSDLQQSEEQRALLQQDLNKVQSNLQQSEEQRALLQQDLNKAQSDLQQSEEQRALLQQDLNKVQSNLQQSEEQRVLLQQDLNKVQFDLQQSEEQRVLLQEDLNKAQSDLQQSEEQRVLLQQDLNKAQSDLQQSEEQSVLLLQDLNTVQSKLSANHSDLTESSSVKSINGCENSMQSENKNMAAELYTAFLQEFSLCQCDRENAKVCLQQMDKKDEDLEKACKILQHEKALVAEENHNLIPSFDMCGTDSSMAEKSHISTNETRHSGFENIFLQSDLQRLNAKDENSITCPCQNENAESLNILDELQQCDNHCNSACKDLKHSNAQLKEEIMKLKQQLSSCQHQNKKLHEQHCNIVSKVTELRSIIAALQTEKVILLDKVNVIKQTTDAGTSVYTKLNEIINMSLETKHQNLIDEIACSVENGSSDGNKHILNTIEKQGDAVKEVEAKLSLLQSKMMECQAALSGTKIEKGMLHAQLTMLEYPLESIYLHISELKEYCQEKDNELILLHQQLKENSANMIINDQAASFEVIDLKMNSFERESCCISSEQSIILLQEQLQKKQADADAEIQKLQNTITATRQALESLKYQHASEMEEWELKLSNITTEMGNKLAAQKQQTEFLSAELEAARIQLQTLDLGSQSLLNASNLSEESTSQKLTNTSSAQQKEINITTDKLEFVNVPVDTIPDHKVQSQEKTDLPLGPLEKKVLLLEEENHSLSNELQSSALENQILSSKAQKLEEELSDVTMQLKVDKGKVFEMARILESLEMDKGDKKEQFLQLEMELKRTRSNKTNLENHILEMEIDLEKLQMKKHILEKEHESVQQAIHVQAEKLTELEAKNNVLIKDLDTLVETNEKLRQTNESLKTKVQEFEAEKIYNANTNGVLEEEITKLTSKLQAVAEQMEQVSTEKEDLIQQLQYMEKGAELATEGEGELRKQLNQLKEENISMREQTEDLQNKIEVLELEKVKLHHSLESSLLEKREVAARLNSTTAEVVAMRQATEKLKVRLEADQKKTHGMAEKLKERDRKADSLQDKIEALERELQASEESMEDLVLQAEAAKEQVEELEEEKKTITEKLEVLVVDLNTLSTEKQDLEKQLQQHQEQLENHCSNLLASEAAKMENLKTAEAYDGSINELQTQISHLNEKVKICHEELETLRENEKNYLNQNSCLECEKLQLSNRVQDAAGSIVGLQSANALLNKDLQVVRQKLDEHIKEKEKLQKQIVDLEKLKQNDSIDVCNLQIELENLKKESQNLQKAAAESQQAACELSAKHNTMLITKETLEKQLQKELQVAQLQTSELLHQVNELTENNNKLQSDLSFADEELLKLQQDLDKEKNSISAQLEEFRNQAESFKTQLKFAQSENYKLEKDLGCIQNELQATDMLKKQNEEYKQSLSCIQVEHQTKIKDVQEKVEELQKSIGKLRREKDCAQSKLLLWMKSCKQLEHEKESLKRHIQQQEELLTKLPKSQILDQNTQIEELSTEMEELKETLEERSKEADENMEKYWNLIKSMHKLEEENEMLKGRVSLLNNKLQQPNSWNEKSVIEQSLEVTAVHQNPGQSNSRQTPPKSPNVSNVSGLPMDEPLKVGVHKSCRRSPDGQIKQTAKRFRGVEYKEEEAELKRETHQNCLEQTRYGNAQDETSEDLLEKVKKGFEEVPSASSSPCPLRQSMLFNRVSSSLSAQSKVTPRRPRQHKGVVQTAKGSHLHQHPTESTCSPSAFITAPLVAETLSSLSSLTNNQKKKNFVKLDGDHFKSRCSLNAKKSIEEKKQHKEQIADTGGNENCKVQ